MQFLDSFLNKITMYRLMLYYLGFLFFTSVILSFFKVIPYNSLDILISGIYISFVCYLSNRLLGYFFKITPNFESQFITALILVLIVGPAFSLQTVVFLTAVSIIAMASKYAVTIRSIHIFNPAAFAVVLAAIFMGRGASWWIGSIAMAPFIILGGAIILRKIKRIGLFTSFLLPYSIFVIIVTHSLSSLFDSSILFFAIVMLTEPLTSPTTNRKIIYYGLFTAVAFIILQKTTSIYYSLELSLLLANIFSRIISFRGRFILVLKNKREIGEGIWEFVFEAQKSIKFVAGQFLEWSLPHKNEDSRGSRRYFTIASSPKEKEISIAVKIPENPSSFKKSLKSLQIGGRLYAQGSEGDFVLDNTDKNYVFVAGGIGITPFKSIIEYLLESNMKLSITLIYCARKKEEFVFKDMFSKAEKELGLKLIYVETQTQGYLDEKKITNYSIDFKKSIFYLSGPQLMVQSFEDLLRGMKTPKRNIKVDFFPGYSEK